MLALALALDRSFVLRALLPYWRWRWCWVGVVFVLMQALVLDWRFVLPAGAVLVLVQALAWTLARALARALAWALALNWRFLRARCAGAHRVVKLRL